MKQQGHDQALTLLETQWRLQTKVTGGENARVSRGSVTTSAVIKETSLIHRYFRIKRHFLGGNAVKHTDV